MSAVTPERPADSSPIWVGALGAVTVGLGLVVVLIAVSRLVLFGWATVSPDDARYVFVGLSTLDGRGPVTPDENVFLLRSPVYGLVLTVLGWPFGDPIDGARIVAASISVAGLLGAIWLGWRIGGPIAGVATALCVIATPLIWRLMPTLRIDLPQTAGVIAVVIALQRQTTRRWAMAGVLLGMTILVKETIALLAVLPIAALGFVPERRLAAMWLVYLACAGAIAAWWWVVVWQQAGVIFPLNALGVIERRGVGADIRLNWYGIVLLAAMIASWVVVAWRARRELPSRFLVVAAICLAVPAAYATLSGLSARNYVGLAVLSAVAFGIAVATVWSALQRRAAGQPRVLAVAALTFAVLLGVGALLGQRAAGRPTQAQLPDQIADRLAGTVEAGTRVVMSFLYGEVTAVELFDVASVPKVPVSQYDPRRPISDYLWLGVRNRQLFGTGREAWAAALGNPRTTKLVLTGPHALTPDELLPPLRRGLLPGVGPPKQLEAADDWATIYDIDSTAAATIPDLPLHLSPATAGAWLDLAGGSQDAGYEQQLIDSRPVLIGPGARRVLDRLAGQACLIPAGEVADRFACSRPRIRMHRVRTRFAGERSPNRAICRRCSLHDHWGMQSPIVRGPRRTRVVAIAAFLVVVAVLQAVPRPALAGPGVLPPGPSYASWEVTYADIANLGSPRSKLLVKAFSPSTQSPPPVVRYLDEAAKYRQKVLVYFTDTVNYSNGMIKTSVIPAWVSKVKNHPALYGYLSVKEPSWSGISLAEMRSLYNAYRAADPAHPVVALLGDVPHFGASQNPWGTGVANVLWVDWYPVTYSRGYIGTASTHFPKVRAYVASKTPGTPIWLMVQGHGNRPGDRRTPTAAELTRQVNDGKTYLRASGIAFYTWRNALYDNDFVRNPKLWATARSLMVSGMGEVFVPQR